MRRDVSAVTVHATGHRVDVVLPNTVPLVELTPVVAALCGMDGEDARPAAWTLARVGRPPLALTATLADAEVLDGEVLHLVDVSAWESPHVVAFDDPVAAAAAEGERPASALAGVVPPAFAAALIATGAVAAAVTSLRTTAGPALLAATAALLSVAYLLPGGAARTRPKAAFACGAWAMAFVAGWSLTSGVPHAGLTGGAVALLVAVFATRPLTPAVVPAMAVLAAALTAASAAVSAGARPAQAAAAAAVAASVALRVGPRLISARLSRRAALAPGNVEALARESRALLVAGTYGCVAVAVAAALVVAAAGDAFGLGLLAVTAASLALRASTFRYAREALPPAAGACVVGIIAVAGAAALLSARGWAGAAVIVPVAAGTAVAAFGARRRAGRGGLGKVATWWALLDGATAPLALVATGVLQAVADLVSGAFG